MNKKSFLEEKYCEINQLKIILQTYPKEYCETIIKVMNNVFDEISYYLENEKKKLKKSKKRDKIEQQYNEPLISEKDNSLGVAALISDKRQDSLKEYRIEEIAMFDGNKDRPSYVVVYGIVYDVTDIKQWSNGKHYGIIAGRDLSEYFKSCHKDEVELLSKLRAVGKIIE